ncbi:MAG: bifunctional glutamate N-acetyltransferase/amino-acid acetyltransferase ArgJ [Anaerolineae bacterium]
MSQETSTPVFVKGFKVAGIHAGLKADGALDMALIYSETPCVAAGVFTTNTVKAAPVLVDQETLAKNNTHIRAVIVNTKCANACTGQQGIDNAHQMQRWTAEKLGIREDEVLVMSTGVIGTQLPMEKIQRGIGLAVDALGEHHWEAAAQGIMTTDTRPKLSGAVFKADAIANFEGHIAGIAKGAGMIAPNMATMLGVLATDVSMNPQFAQSVLTQVTERSFNRIVVDGDMSTNDTLLLLANAATGENSGVEGLQGLMAHYGLHVAQALAQMIVRDGEGVTKFITLNIKGAPDADAAQQIGNAIATSPLVKTAFYGGDANWGRIVAAAGRSGIAVIPEKMSLTYASPDQKQLVLLFTGGVPANYDEAAATALAKAEEIVVTLDCGMGTGDATIWTCDLSHDYVSINGHYRS